MVNLSKASKKRNMLQDSNKAVQIYCSMKSNIAGGWVIPFRHLWGGFGAKLIRGFLHRCQNTDLSPLLTLPLLAPLLKPMKILMLVLAAALVHLHTRHYSFSSLDLVSRLA